MLNKLTFFRGLSASRADDMVSETVWMAFIDVFADFFDGRSIGCR